MLISQRLEQLARQHDDARRVVGVFLIENADRFDQLTMADIAAETYTSKPTLVRVAKQLGYSGWRAFSAAYAREIDRQRQIDSSVDHSLPFGDGAFARDIAHSIAQVRAESTLLTVIIGAVLINVTKTFRGEEKEAEAAPQATEAEEAGKHKKRFKLPEYDIPTLSQNEIKPIKTEVIGGRAELRGEDDA